MPPPAPAAPASTPPVAGAAPAASAAPPAGGSPEAGGASGGENEPSSFDKFDAAFDGLEEGGGQQPPASAKPAAPAAPAAAAAKPAAPTAPAKGASQPKPGDGEFEEVDGIQVPRFKKDGEFRNWGLAGYKKAKTLEGESAQLRTKLQELEQEFPRTKQERDVLKSKYEEIEKRFNAVQEEIKYLNYERSPEYTEKYETPYKNAVSAAYADVAQLTVTEPDPTQPPDAEGKKPTRERQATPNDFDEVYQLPLGPASKVAYQKFGPHVAPTVMRHWNNIRDLAKAATNALSEWKAKSAEREKNQNEQQTLQTGQIQSQWQDVNKKLSEDSRGQEWWGHEKEDKELNDALAQGFAFADKRFSDEFNKLSTTEKIILDAAIRHRVAGFYKYRAKYARLKAEHDQAVKDLAEIRASGPGGGERGTSGGETPTSESKGAMAAFDEKL